MKRITCILSAAAVCLFCSGMILPGVAWAQNMVVRVGGSGVGLGVMRQLAMVFEKSYPNIRIRIVPSLGSAGGIKALVGGTLDLAVTARPPNGTEKGKGLHVRELARSPLVFIANRTVRNDGLTSRELESILSGQTTFWPDGSRLRLVLRPETEMSTKIIRGISPAISRAMTLAMAREGMIRAVTDQESVDSVEMTNGALSASSLTQLISEKRQVKQLMFNGIKPDVQGLVNGAYRLYYSLYLVTPLEIKAPARMFADFIFSREGNAILAAHGNLVVGEAGNAGQ